MAERYGIVRPSAFPRPKGGESGNSTIRVGWAVGASPGYSRPHTAAGPEKLFSYQAKVAEMGMWSDTPAGAVTTQALSTRKGEVFSR
jgi:hypothetical protein